MHPFVIGAEHERAQLLDFTGSGQRQTGVIWGPRQPGCTIVTSGGRHGRNAGYFDERLPDGSWKYFGQGQSGDHLPSNPANKRLIRGEGTVLLFLTREPTSAEIKLKGNYRKSFIFQGEFTACGYESVTPDSGPRAGDTLFRFRLIPVATEAGFSGEETQTVDIAELRKRLLLNFRLTAPDVAVTVYRQRSREMRQYALLRSLGKCEACGAPAPFVNDRGQGFLEVHHINRLADDGLDEPDNIAAVCPNCHRRAHFSLDRDEFKNYLLLAVRKAEIRVITDELNSRRRGKPTENEDAGAKAISFAQS